MNAPPPAEWWRRIVAFLVDALLFGLAWYASAAVVLELPALLSALGDPGQVGGEPSAAVAAGAVVSQIGLNVVASAYAAFLLILVTVVAILVYSALVLPLLMRRGLRRNGQTLGMQLAGVRVVRSGGRPVSFGYAMVRQCLVCLFLPGGVGSVLATGAAAVFDGLGDAAAWIFIAPFVLDRAWALLDSQRRAVHDLVAGSRVVRALPLAPGSRRELA